MTRDVEHLDVASYVLDILEPDEREVARRHIERCALCTRDYREFTTLRGVLDELTLADVTHAAVLPPPTTLDRLLADAGDTRLRDRRRTRRWALATSVLAVVLVVSLGASATLYAGSRRDDGTTTAELLAAGPTFTAADPVSGAAVRVAVKAQAWGTRVAVELRGVHGPVDCLLVAMPAGGGPGRVAAGWSVPAGGAGGPMLIEGSTGLSIDQTAAFEARTVDGRRLVAVHL